MDEHMITGSMSTRGECVSKKRKKKRLRILSAALAASLVLAGSTVFSQVGYAVSVDGRVVGSGRNIDEIEEAVENVEERVSGILGEEYILDEVSYEKYIGSADTEEELEKALMESVECVEEMYVLKLNGAAVAGAVSENDINAAINSVMEKYAPENDGNISYVEGMEVAFEYAPCGLKMTAEEIAAAIDPENGGSTSATVVSVASVDTAETVSYQVEYTTDDTMYEGESRVIQEGADGEIVTTWSIEYENGREVSRSAKSVETNIEPVNEIIAQGTMERPYYMSYGSYIWPTDGVITSYYGYRDVTVGTSYHEGLDIAGQYRSYVVAADGGKVIYAQYNSALGNLVKIQHDNGDVTWYGHNDELCVSEGDLVGRGQVIAYMGSTGMSTGNHVHFEIHIDGQSVDPLDYLP